MMSVRGAAIGMAAALLAGCSTRPEPAPPPQPVAAPLTAVEPSSPLPAADDWRDLALTAGDWSYSNGEARYAGFSLRCDAAVRRVAMTREGAAGPLRVSTTYGERLLPPGAALAADDPLLDEMAFSRGRFAVEAEGMERLILPAWPEPARVVEDCRG